MCRLFGFHSAIDSSVHRSLIAAENALARQSERHGDGWGLSYYIDGVPHLIRNDQRALGDSIYREVSAVVSTRTFIAHIRKATIGRVNVLNSHPFQHGRWSFAHNGEVTGYSTDAAVRKYLLNRVDHRFRRYILGETDSEVLFFIFLSRLHSRVGPLINISPSLDAVTSALRDTVADVVRSFDDTNEKPHRLNILVSNGDLLVGYRYREQLHCSTYKTQCPERGTCPMFDPAMCESKPQRGSELRHLIVASEPVAEGPNVWEEVPENTFVGLDQNLRFQRGQLI